MQAGMYNLSVPVFVRMLNNMSAILDKAAAYATVKKFDPAVYLSTRLAPDMLPFTKQIQIACDFAKGASARLAGADMPKFDDNESSLDELKARIEKTIAFITTVSQDAIDASAEKEITIQIGPNTATLQGLPYLTNMVLPNFYFHLTTAYDLLRHNGVDIGKRDFVGGL